MDQPTTSKPGSAESSQQNSIRLNINRCDQCIRGNCKCTRKDSTMCEECHFTRKKCTRELSLSIPEDKAQQPVSSASFPVRSTPSKSKKPDEKPEDTFYPVYIPDPQPTMSLPKWSCHECFENGEAEKCDGTFPFAEDWQNCLRCVGLDIVCRPPPTGPRIATH